MTINEKIKNSLKKRSYLFSIQTIRAINGWQGNNRPSWVLLNQLIRCATSIGANIFEAQAASSKKEYINFYQIALKSCLETQYWLCLLRDVNLVPAEEIRPLLQEAVEIDKMLGKSLITLKGKWLYEKL